MEPTRAALQWNPSSKKHLVDSLTLLHFGTEQGGGQFGVSVTLYSALSTFFFTCDPNADFKKAHITSRLQPSSFSSGEGEDLFQIVKSCDPQSIWLSSVGASYFLEKKKRLCLLKTCLLQTSPSLFFRRV